MKKIVLIIFGVILLFSSSAQNKCKISNLPPEEKKLLELFWSKLIDGIKTKNKQKIAVICHFAMPCSICDSNGDSSPYLLLTKQGFNKKYHRIFFTDYLFEVVTKNKIFDILFDQEGSSDTCTYNIGFPVIKPSKKWEGVQGFFSIRKIGKTYKIVSIWLVP